MSGTSQTIKSPKREQMRVSLLKEFDQGKTVSTSQYALPPLNTPAVVCIDVPVGSAMSTLTALAHSFDLRSVPVLPTKGVPNAEQFHLSHRNTIAVIDISRLSDYGTNIFEFAKQVGGRDVRQRILFVTTQGWASKARVALVQSLGFADLVDDIDPSRQDSGVLTLAQWLSEFQARLQPAKSGSNDVRIQRLASYLKTVPQSKTILGHQNPIAIIQRYTKQSVEQTLQEMYAQIDIKDRLYNLKKYPICFLGTQACDWLTKRFKLSDEQALAVGNALIDVGALYHVAHEQPFANQDFFYRLAYAPQAHRFSLAAIAKALVSQSQGIEIKDRTYLGTTYEQCFVGKQAIDDLSGLQA